MREKIRQILEQEVVTGPEAERLLGVKEVTLRQRVNRGILKAVKKGDVWLYDIDDIQFIRKGRNKLKGANEA